MTDKAASSHRLPAVFGSFTKGKRKVKLLWMSNAMHVKTGYGVQTNLFAPRLQKAGHDTAVLAYYGLEGGIINYNGVLCFPKAQHPYGMDVMNAHAHNFKADAIFTLMDAWVVQAANMAPFKWIAWFPVDHDTLPPKVRDAITLANYRIAMSKHGLSETNKAGLDSYYVPHAVDTELYKPMGKTKAREILRLPKDAYIVGTVAMNKGQPSRKNIPAMIQAFAIFKQRHPEAIYYMHTQEGIGTDGLGGINIPEMCGILGLRYGTDVILPNAYNMMIGLNDEMMATLYSAMDVHLLASMGEGFGIPIIEAQACGTPVIVGGWTAMPELVHSGQIIDKKDAEPLWTGIAAYQYIAKVGAIVEAMEAEYKKPSSKSKAREGIVQNYDVKVAFEKNMLPTINEIEQRFLAENERWEKVAEARK